ncbi:hypothetical protein N7456_012179 [Penicillium angulare]|uniref:Protein kinase domain-containing protein n=1 Tax=Penicillium angulare TaxID=116970 RepID=A0A9W9EV33_9EURO|nr:hypothetical protein N7456_012179 [Penicillium angulare]
MEYVEEHLFKAKGKVPKHLLSLSSQSLIGPKKQLKAWVLESTMKLPWFVTSVCTCGGAINAEADIFAFGSMLFEIETGKVPYSEVEDILERGDLMRTVERLLSENKFPMFCEDAGSKVLGPSIISGCWCGDFGFMASVLEDILYNTCAVQVFIEKYTSLS